MSLRASCDDGKKNDFGNEMQIMPNLEENIPLFMINL